MPEVIIAVDALTKRFGEFTAVDRVSFQVGEGEIFGFLGPNGSGKTTTIRMLLGLLLPSAGQARVLGYDAVQETERIRARSGYMSQQFALYDELTAWENLVFYAGVYGIRDPHRLAEVQDRLGLSAIAAERAGELPIGWRQRLALAAAIVHHPALLFLDEPTSGVDPLTRRAFWDLIYAMADDGVTIFVTTHYMDEAEYCGRIGFMRQGKLMRVGTPGELKATALAGSVWDVYAEPLIAALDTLASSPEVLQSGLAGDHLRVVPRAGLRPSDLASLLRAAGHDFQKAEPAEPTLEDVFLALAAG